MSVELIAGPPVRGCRPGHVTGERVARAILTDAEAAQVRADYWAIRGSDRARGRYMATLAAKWPIVSVRMLGSVVKRQTYRHLPLAPGERRYRSELGADADAADDLGLIRISNPESRRHRSVALVNPSAKLTTDRVQDIRREYWAAAPRVPRLKALAACEGVHYTTIAALLRRDHWRGLPRVSGEPEAEIGRLGKGRRSRLLSVPLPGPRGEELPSAKLTECLVQEIRRRRFLPRDQRPTYKALAAWVMDTSGLRISREAIRLLLDRRTWAHLPRVEGEPPLEEATPC